MQETQRPHPDKAVTRALYKLHKREAIVAYICTLEPSRAHHTKSSCRSVGTAGGGEEGEGGVVVREQGARVAWLNSENIPFPGGRLPAAEGRNLKRGQRRRTAGRRRCDSGGPFGLLSVGLQKSDPPLPSSPSPSPPHTLPPSLDSSHAQSITHEIPSCIHGSHTHKHTHINTHTHTRTHTHTQTHKHFTHTRTDSNMQISLVRSLYE